MQLSLIVAMSKNRVIGRGGQLPWHLAADLRRFKQLTMGHHLIMGRKTWESIGRPLPGRTSVVISRQSTYQAPGARVVPDLPSACQAAAGDDQAFIIGGGLLYQEALAIVDRIYLTRVHARVDGDTYFPEWREEDWRLVEQSPRQPADQKNDHDYSFLVYERMKALERDQRWGGRKTAP
jgi:dihydrofolate reductase